jgi:excisionase family DNA binding protein
MTAAEAARKIGISLSLTYELCRLGVIRHSRHGRPGKRGCIRISEDAIAEYLRAAERVAVPLDAGPLRHLR